MEVNGRRGAGCVGASRVGGVTGARRGGGAYATGKREHKSERKEANWRRRQGGNGWRWRLSGSGGGGGVETSIGWRSVGSVTGLEAAGESEAAGVAERKAIWPFVTMAGNRRWRWHRVAVERWRPIVIWRAGARRRSGWKIGHVIHRWLAPEAQMAGVLALICWRRRCLWGGKERAGAA